jgi:hypothetical protein
MFRIALTASPWSHRHFVGIAYWASPYFAGERTSAKFKTRADAQAYIDAHPVCARYLAEIEPFSKP